MMLEEKEIDKEKEHIKGYHVMESFSKCRSLRPGFR